MSVSTQRLLVLILALNIMATVATGFYQAPVTSGTTQLTNYVDINEQYAIDVAGEESLASFAGQQEEGSFGSNVRMGKALYGLFVRGLNPLSFTVNAFNDPVEMLIGFGLILLRSILVLFIGLEIVLLIKNRKTG